MNRWRSRLAALQTGAVEPRATVQNVQIVQKSSSVPSFERFEPIEPHTAGTWTDTQEERAAIIEHDGGVPRAWAEALARLDPTEPPAGMPPEDWNRVIDAGCRLVDDGWHKQANALGWGPLELFGCDRTFPMRPRAKGLLWRLGELCRDSDDTHLVALTAHGALVETGERDIYLRRNPPVPGQVLTWEVGEWRRTGQGAA
jgi:hypothetical protein